MLFWLQTLILDDWDKCPHRVGICLSRLGSESAVKKAQRLNIFESLFLAIVKPKINFIHIIHLHHYHNWWHRWGEMQQQVLVYQVHDVDELNQRLIDMFGMVLSIVSLICECMKFWAFILTPYIMHILFCLSYLLIFWTQSKSYCVRCSRILPISVFCVLQDSRVTRLKCDEISDIAFVANFTENTTVKNI